uniref:Gld_28 protein n=1 Tax=Fopius arisanus TaxID=64838 RepID=A0A0C9Q781_9HYME
MQLSLNFFKLSLSHGRLKIACLLILSCLTASCCAEKIYINLYGDEPFGVIENVIKTIIGTIKFMYDALRFLFWESSEITPESGAEFDFVVVGAGTAGAAIAARLSEISNFRVLLIEAGPSETIFMDIPVHVNDLQFRDDINWKYQAEPSDNYCRGMTDKRCNLPRGKVMGGSSVLNYLIATRGHPDDYNRWEDLGNEGWSWKDVLPYFKKLETMEIPPLKNDKEHHNDDGPVHINYAHFQTPLAEAFLQAGNELGYKTIDYNNPDEPVGFSYLQTTSKDGMRCSSNRAYIHPAKSRENLLVTKNTLVSKVLIDDNNRAIGVEYIKGGKTYQIYANKEIILSAGAVGSPQILMLSGIGPGDHLKEMGINPRVDLPVGENLMDHIAYGGLIFHINQPVGLHIYDIVNPINPYLSEYFLYRTGPLTLPGGCEALAFLDVDDPNNHTAYPNIELLFASSSFVTVSTARHNLGVADDVWQETYAADEDSYTWMVFPMLLRPKSRGKILLRTPDIESKPIIIPDYMADKEDVRILIEGIKATLRISETKAMRRFGSQLFKSKFKACQGIEEFTDQYWECAIRTITMNIYHYSGTCKMGPKGDLTAVVDSRLRVYFHYSSFNYGFYRCFRDFCIFCWLSGTRHSRPQSG